jgi:hypothetical protein
VAGNAARAPALSGWRDRGTTTIMTTGARL